MKFFHAEMKFIQCDVVVAYIINDFPQTQVFIWDQLTERLVTGLWPVAFGWLTKRIIVTSSPPIVAQHSPSGPSLCLYVRLFLSVYVRKRPCYIVAWCEMTEMATYAAGTQLACPLSSTRHL